MSTRSVVGYRNEDGEVRGTYVHFDGYPDNMLPELNKRFQEKGYEGSKAWIEAGIEGGGYSSVGDEIPYNDNDEPWNMALDEQEYGYVVSESGVEMEYSLDD